MADRTELVAPDCHRAPCDVGKATRGGGIIAACAARRDDRGASIGDTPKPAEFVVPVAEAKLRSHGLCKPTNCDLRIRHWISANFTETKAKKL